LCHCAAGEDADFEDLVNPAAIAFVAASSSCDGMTEAIISFSRSVAAALGDERSAVDPVGVGRISRVRRLTDGA